MTDTRDSKAHKNKSRPARIPMSAGNKLHVSAELKKEGFQYYWQVNKPGIIEQMQRAYWDIVKDDRGESVTVPAGNGDMLYLMEIEQKYYDEDIASQQKQNVETTTNKAQKLGEDEYVPMGHKSVVEREII